MANIPLINQSTGSSHAAKLPAYLGATFLITGIALFIIDAVSAIDFHTAALACTSTGAGVFVLGLMVICCRHFADQDERQVSPSRRPANTTANVVKPKPIAMEIATKDFFESEGLFGMPEELIDEVTIWRRYLTHSGEREWDISLDAGFIVYGPPGSGKTKLMTVLAKLFGAEHQEVRASDLLGIFHGESELKMTKVFTVPEDQFRVILFDEIDSILTKRGNRESDRYHNGIVSHFLSLVNGAENKKPRFILIGSTNRVDQIDPAVQRAGRLGKQFHLGPPNNQARKAMLLYHLNQEKIVLEEDERGKEALINYLVKITQGHSCATIFGCISNAKKKALLAGRAVAYGDIAEAIERLSRVEEDRSQEQVMNFLREAFQGTLT